jgi:predicted  nucleic acid-binding Zn-ribbon protein
MIKIRILQAEHAAAVARIAAIEARIRQIREESESRIKALSDEREALARREKELSESLETARP